MEMKATTGVYKKNMCLKLTLGRRPNNLGNLIIRDSNRMMDPPLIASIKYGSILIK